LQIRQQQVLDDSRPGIGDYSNFYGRNRVGACLHGSTKRQHKKYDARGAGPEHAIEVIYSEIREATRSR
ncbi:MAG TPA: hypothetical protein VK985_13840, partial [Rariglobus sp.]|nr:hypothetical protein [Rariglobus sp.]